MWKGIDLNALLNAIYYVCLVIIMIGLKMKWWKESDFHVAKRITVDGIKTGASNLEIASKISNATKLTGKQALVEVREIVTDMKGTEKPMSKRIQRSGRKLIWRLLDGGL